jgi:SAM-dependent methyltransferase
MPTSVWSLGDYPTIARDILAPLGPELVAACGVGPGMRVLDVGAGTGNAAIPAALAGAEVVALDPSPELVAIGRDEAIGRQAAVEWVIGDAQALPHADGEFDVVLSCVGAMFAPDHARTAHELTRVCRPGGTIGLIAWEAGGSGAELMKVVARHAPPPPVGVGSPVAWGDEAHVRELFGDRVSELQSRVAILRSERFADAEEATAFYMTSFSPAVALSAQLPPERIAALRDGVAGWARSAMRTGAMEFEYLLTVATRAS